MRSVRRKELRLAVDISGESVCLRISTKRFMSWGSDKKTRGNRRDVMLYDGVCLCRDMAGIEIPVGELEITHNHLGYWVRHCQSNGYLSGNFYIGEDNYTTCRAPAAGGARATATIVDQYGCREASVYVTPKQFEGRFGSGALGQPYDPHDVQGAYAWGLEEYEDGVVDLSVYLGNWWPPTWGGVQNGAMIHRYNSTASVPIDVPQITLLRFPVRGRVIDGEEH